MAVNQNEISFQRQLDIVSPQDLAKISIMVIGAGGIGSKTVRELAKMGAPNITVYDHDIVEAHNSPNTVYTKRDRGHLKVDRLQEICEADADVRIIKMPFRFPVKGETISGVVISAVDSLAIRRMIWQYIKKNKEVPLYIDGRMSGESMKIYTIDPNLKDDIELYEETISPDIEPFQESCTARAITYNTSGIATFIANHVKRFAKGEQCPREILFDYAAPSFDVTW